MRTVQNIVIDNEHILIRKIIFEETKDKTSSGDVYQLRSELAAGHGKPLGKIIVRIQNKLDN